MNPNKSVRKIRRSKYPILKPLPQSSQVLVKSIIDYILLKTEQRIEKQQEMQNDRKVTQIMTFINHQYIKQPLNQVLIKKSKLKFSDSEPISQPNKTIIQITSNIEDNNEQKHGQIIFQTLSDQNVIKVKQIIPTRLKNVETPRQRIFIRLEDIILKKQQEQRQIDPEFRQIMLKKRQKRVKKQQQIIKQRIKGRYDRYRLNKFSLRHLDSTKPSISSSIIHTCCRDHTHFKIESATISKKTVVKTQNNSPHKLSSNNSHYSKQISLHRTKTNYEQSVKTQIPLIKSFHTRSIQSSKPALRRYLNKIL